MVDIVDGGGLSRQSRLIRRFGGLEVLEFQLGGFCLKMRELLISHEPSLSALGNLQLPLLLV